MEKNPSMSDYAFLQATHPSCTRKSRKRSASISSVLLVPHMLFLFACAPALHVNEIPIAASVEPSRYASYHWDGVILNEDRIDESVDVSFDELIQQTVDVALQAKGYARSEADRDSMIIAIQLTVKDTSEAFQPTTTTDPQDESQSYGLRWRFPVGESPVDLQRMTPVSEISYFSEGILHIGAFTPGKELIWHAMGHKILVKSHSPEEHEATLRRTVAEIMRRFPNSAARR